jgi:hypothetical protein
VNKKVLGTALAAVAAGVAAGYVHEWWQARHFELFDPEWIRWGKSCSCRSFLYEYADDAPQDLVVTDEWCPVHGDPDLGSLIADG